MPEPPAYVCDHVFVNSHAVLLVQHEDGDWQFLCGGLHESGVLPRVVGLNHLLTRDPSLALTLGLPEGWEAARTDSSAPWQQSRIV